MLTRFSWADVKDLPKTVLIRLIIVAITELRSSRTISVNKIPITESSLYQPITSVTRVASERAATMGLSDFRLFVDGIGCPRSTSVSKKGFRERSLRLRSRANMRWKASASNTIRSSGVVGDGITGALIPFVTRLEFTSHSPDICWCFKTEQGLLMLKIWEGTRHNLLTSFRRWHS